MNNAISVDRVADLLRGGATPTINTEEPTSPARKYSHRYDSCDRCEVIQPCLMTFRGRLDWSPGLAEDDPLRERIESLRAATGRRTILLCGSCLTALRIESTAVPTTDGRLPIDWN